MRGDESLRRQSIQFLRRKLCKVFENKSGQLGCFTRFCRKKSDLKDKAGEEKINTVSI